MLLRRPLAGNRNPGKTATLQWHLTSRCEGNCSFCYLLDSPNYESELKNELGLKQCLRIIRNLAKYLREKDYSGWVNLTGGDPLLKEGFWDILTALKNSGVEVGIFGNPHLIDHQTADKLKRYGVGFYQLSIDGLAATHDYFRGAGSFEKTWDAARILKENNIPVTISLTMSRRNFGELDELVDLCYQYKASSFRPTRLVPEGKGKQYNKDLLTPQEYRKALFDTLKKIALASRREGYFLNYPICDSLVIPLIAGIEGNYIPLHLKGALAAKKGCKTRFLALSPEGTLYPCRRLPIKIGNILEMSFREAYESELAQKLRNPGSYKKCSGCDLLALCQGGCPAITYAVTGDPFGKDPQCWIDIGDKKSNNFRRLPEDEKGGKLFQPLKIGSLICQNRIFRSATLERAALPDGSPTTSHSRIYRELAEGGCGLIITGVAYVSEEGKINGGENGIQEDYLIAKWKKITDDVHLSGGKIAMQLTHQSINDVPYKGELMGPSPHQYLTKFGKFVLSREMFENEILAVIDQFKQAVLRVEAAGFDAVQLQLAHGYMLGLFLSPRINLRKDRWGGNLENRLRISTEIVKGVRKELKDEKFPLIVKINSSDGVPGGLTVQETSAAVGILSARGVDAFEISGEGSVRSGAFLCSGDKECYFQKEGEYLRKNNPGVILGICGGIRSRNKMDELLSKGFDFVSMSRPFIREPDLVKKMRENPAYQPKCVSCSICYLKIKHYPLKCHLKRRA